jgi:hypothetical protein
VKIIIHDFKLLVHRLYLTPQFESTIAKKISTSKIYYNFTRNVMRTYQLVTGATYCNWNNVFIGKMPRAVYFCLMDNSQLSGDSEYDPQWWGSYKMTSASVEVNGNRFPANGVNYDDSVKDQFNGYRWFVDNIGVGSDDEININIWDYYMCRFIVPFDLTPRADNGFLMHMPDSGFLNFDCRFSEATSKPLTMICYGVFNNSIEVDPKKDVKLDYSI